MGKLWPILRMPYAEAEALLIQDNTAYLMIDGYQVRRSSQRYELFRTKGTTCVHCGLQGTTMVLEYPNIVFDPSRPQAHFNLYSNCGVLFTKDHIKPKSKGGKNVLENYQTMCAPCNSQKGNDMAPSWKPEHWETGKAELAAGKALVREGWNGQHLVLKDGIYWQMQGQKVVCAYTELTPRFTQARWQVLQ